ncbi:hypothetical protein GCM10027217_31330 [Pseudomaricurvus hydrocarbonicus]
MARQKEMVQLARGMDAQGNLAPEALQRAQACLTHFQEILSSYPQAIKRSVGTQALRQCQNLAEFLHMAEPLLGCPIEIISGQREAELVYRGVQFCLPAAQRHEQSLIVDIGGASTELLIGQGPQIKHWHSFSLGCVDLANRFLGGSRPRRKIPAQALEQAYQYSYDLLSEQAAAFNNMSWALTLGASGTMRVILDLLPVQPAPPRITQAHLQQLLEELRVSGEISEQIPDSLRWDVLPAGLALLSAIFDSLNIEQLDVSPGSIKEGMMLESLDGITASMNQHQPKMN